MITRRRFFAVLSALVAVPAFVRVKADEFKETTYDDITLLDRADIMLLDRADDDAPPWTCILFDEYERRLHSYEVPYITSWAVVPVRVGLNGWYEHTRFSIVSADNDRRIAIFRYVDGPHLQPDFNVTAEVRR